jgi:hypothetical protein
MPCTHTYVAAPSYPRMWCSRSGVRDRGSGTQCEAMEPMPTELRRDTNLYKDAVPSPHPVANGRPTGQGCGDGTVLQQPVGMRRFGVQGCNATPAQRPCVRGQPDRAGVAVPARRDSSWGCRGRRPAPDAQRSVRTMDTISLSRIKKHCKAVTFIIHHSSFRLRPFQSLAADQ